MNHSNAIKALKLRVEALALLQQAESLDRLKPYAVTHEHRSGSSTYFLWASHAPSTEEACTVLDAPFESELDETLDIMGYFTLDELTGVSIGSRLDNLVEFDASSGWKPGEWGTLNGLSYIVWWRYGDPAKAEDTFVPVVRTYASEEERRQAYSPFVLPSHQAVWLATPSDALQKKQIQLAQAGYLVGPRDPAVRPGHAGAFMVKDQQDSDGYCIVGDDIDALVTEAHDHLT